MVFEPATRRYELWFEVAAPTESELPTNDEFMHAVNQGLPDDFYCTPTDLNDEWGITSMSTDIAIDKDQVLS